MAHLPVLVAKASMTTSVSTASPSTSTIAKLVDESTFEELIKKFNKLKVEMSELRKAQISNSFQTSDSERRYVKRCIFCNKKIKEDEGYRLRDCEAFDEAIVNGIVYFKDSKLHDAATDLSLFTNYSKDRMRKLLENEFGKTNALHFEDATAYNIEMKYYPTDVSKTVTMKMMKRGAHAIRKATKWEDLVDATSILAIFREAKRDNEQYKALAEEK